MKLFPVLCADKATGPFSVLEVTEGPGDSGRPFLLGAESLESGPLLVFRSDEVNCAGFGAGLGLDGGLRKARVAPVRAASLVGL